MVSDSIAALFVLASGVFLEQVFFFWKLTTWSVFLVRMRSYILKHSYLCSLVKKVYIFLNLGVFVLILIFHFNVLISKNPEINVCTPNASLDHLFAESEEELF